VRTTHTKKERGMA